MRVITESESRRLLAEHRSWDEQEKRLRDFVRKYIASDPACSTNTDLDRPLGSFFAHLHVAWCAGWATDCRVEIRVESEDARVAGEETDAGLSDVYQVYTVRSIINWSATNRSVRESVATLAMYQRAVEFAAIVETMFDGEFWQEPKPEETT